MKSPTSNAVETRIPAYHRGAQDVIKRVSPDGSVSYHHPQAGIELNTYNNFYRDWYDVLLSRIKIFADSLNDDLYSQVGDLINCIVTDAEREIEAVNAMLDKKIGHIKFTCISKNSACYRTGRVIDAELIPPKPEKEILA